MPQAHKSRRVFFALWPDQAVARRFEAAGGRAHETLGGRRLRRANLHLTLAFVGAVGGGRLQDLREIAGAIRLPPFRLRFARLECLRGKRIVWAAAEIPPGLRDLAEALRAGLAAARFPVEERPFAAHVTLLRNADCSGLAPPADGLPIDWAVEDFVLAESDLHPEGARYRILARWRLAAGD